MRALAKLGAVVCLLSVALAGSAGCSSGNDTANACEEENVDKFKELVVVEESVLTDARAKNATSGAWSFRHVIENMAPEGTDASEFVATWLNSWRDVKSLNGVPTDRANEERGQLLDEKLVCPWLKRTASNACDENCGVCAARKLDLRSAPFRLIAITNRLDLRDEVAGEESGEGRLVYALTAGPSDDPQSLALPMSVIFEYQLPESRSPQEWAKTWHALGGFPSYDEPFLAALEAVTNSFVSRGSRATAKNGSAIAQVRTNESAFNWIWQLREFAIADDGMLRIRLARNTPAEAFNDTPQLAAWVTANESAIRARRFELPVSFRGPSVDQLLYSWRLSTVKDSLRNEFAKQTCNGCHSLENPSVDNVFHVSPFRTGTAKLSPFLYNPAGGPDELTARSASLHRALCSGK